MFGAFILPFGRRRQNPHAKILTGILLAAVVLSWAIVLLRVFG
jgi:hypothetical protein